VKGGGGVTRAARCRRKGDRAPFSNVYRVIWVYPSVEVMVLGVHPIYTYVCMYVGYMYMYVYICMYIYVCVYICIYVCTATGVIAHARHGVGEKVTMLCVLMCSVYKYIYM